MVWLYAIPLWKYFASDMATKVRVDGTTDCEEQERG